MRDIGGGRDGHKRGIAHAALHLGAQRLPVEAASRVNCYCLTPLRAKSVDRVDRQFPLAPATARKVRIATARHCQLSRLIDSIVANKLRQLIDQLIRRLRFIAQLELLQHISQAHKAQANRPVLQIAIHRFRDGCCGNVYKIIKLARGRARGLLEPWPIPCLGRVIQESAEVNTHQVAHRNIVLILRQSNLCTEVTKMNGTSIIVKRTEIDSILPGEPWVAGRLQTTQNSVELLARR